MSGARSPVAPRGRRWRWLLAGAVALAVAAGGGAWLVLRSDGTSRTHAAVPAGSTEELGSGRTLVSPGTRSGTVRTGGIVVVGADYHLGAVPMLVTAVPTWQLRNETDHAVTLGTATVHAEQGCCAGTLTVVSRTVAPAASTTVQLALTMKPGQEGRHRVVVTIPVVGAAKPLRFRVDGEFGR